MKKDNNKVIINWLKKDFTILCFLYISTLKTGAFRQSFYKLFFLRSTLVLLFSFWSCFALTKYQVCSITINSADEIEMFKNNLSSEHFEFVELVPLSVDSRPNNVHWFTQACRKEYKCDILVISGHFGGLFFGEKNNYILPVDIMEKQACSHSCSSVLSHVKEVFLFGCYTLSNKQSRQRTPEQHLQVLLEHHYARDVAEIMVAAIYLPFGLSFQERMQWIFPYQSSIYGFTELSPLGRYLRQPLSDYFQQITKHYGSYKSYLDQRRPQTNNSLIYPTIGGAISEVKGIGPHSHQSPHLQNMCRLYEDNVNPVESMQVVKALMESGDGPKAYLPIKNFVSENQPFRGQSLEIFREIKSNSSFKTEFYILYEQINSRLPYVKIQFLNFLNFFGWVSSDFYQKELKSNTLRIIRHSTSEAYDFALALVYDEKVPVQQLGLSADDFPDEFYKNIWSALVMEAFHIQDYRMHRKLMNMCLAKVTEDPVICYQVLKTLGHLRVSDSLIINKMEEFVKLSHSGLVYYSIYGLAYSGVQVESVHLTIAERLNHPDKWVNLQAISALGLLQSQYPQVNQQLVNVIKFSVDEDIIERGLHSLHNMKPPLQELRRVIVDRQFYEHPNKNIRDLASTF